MLTSLSNEIRTRRKGLTWRASSFSSLSKNHYAAVPGLEAHPIQAVSILWSSHFIAQASVSTVLRLGGKRRHGEGKICCQNRLFRPLSL